MRDNNIGNDDIGGVRDGWHMLFIWRMAVASISIIMSILRLLWAILFLSVVACVAATAAAGDSRLHLLLLGRPETFRALFQADDVIKKHGTVVEGGR
jgi:hypothetical protein